MLNKKGVDYSTPYFLYKRGEKNVRKSFIVSVIILAVMIGLYWQTSYINQQKVSMHQSKDFVQAVYKERPPAPIEALKKEPIIQQLALGDSIAAGYGTTGASHHFVNIVSDSLKEMTGKQTTVDNEGIVGMTSGELAQFVQKPSIINKIKRSQLITINIGGNDILDTFKESGGEQTMEEFDLIRTNYGIHMKQILTTIRENNPHATIILMELYTPRYMEKKYKLFSRLFLPDWNAVLEEAASSYEPVVVVKTDRFTDEKDPSIWFKDDIHFNDDGQQDVATGVIQTLKEQPQ